MWSGAGRRACIEAQVTIAEASPSSPKAAEPAPSPVTGRCRGGRRCRESGGAGRSRRRPRNGRTALHRVRSRGRARRRARAASAVGRRAERCRPDRLAGRRLWRDAATWIGPRIFRQGPGAPACRHARCGQRHGRRVPHRQVVRGRRDCAHERSARRPVAHPGRVRRRARDRAAAGCSAEPIASRRRRPRRRGVDAAGASLAARPNGRRPSKRPAPAVAQFRPAARPMKVRR